MAPFSIRARSPGCFTATRPSTGLCLLPPRPWTWPQGLIPGLGAAPAWSIPTPSPPGVAVQASLPWLPADFQYFGAWMLLCHLLHGAFAARILTRLGCDGTARAAATLLLLSSPASWPRAYGHESLMAHWLLLAAIDAWVGQLSRPPGPAALPGRPDPPLLAGALLLAPFALYHWWRAGLSPGATGGNGPAAHPADGGGGLFPSPALVSWRRKATATTRPTCSPSSTPWTGRFPAPLRAAHRWHRGVVASSAALGQATAGQYEGLGLPGAGVLLLLALAAGMALWRRSSGSIGPAGKALTALLPLALVLFPLRPLGPGHPGNRRPHRSPTAGRPPSSCSASSAPPVASVWPLALLLPCLPSPSLPALFPGAPWPCCWSDSACCKAPTFPPNGANSASASPPVVLAGYLTSRRRLGKPPPLSASGGAAAPHRRRGLDRPGPLRRPPPAKSERRLSGPGR
ncbi:DUF6311 domain-containing protein [Denitratisoma oestradiolicum]|nr:DUF6311 domain-containing protein [Denitratisoma oestradiolicum]